MRIWLAALGLAALAVACDDNLAPGDGVSYSQIVGSWKAAEFVFVSQANPTIEVDMIGAGVEAWITIGTNNRYSILIEVPSDTPDVMTGSVHVTSGKVVMENDDEPGNPLSYTAIASTNAVSMVTSDVAFDFDEDGDDEPANLYLTLARQSGVTAANMAGDWEATEFRIMRLPDLADTVDVIGGGGSLLLTITNAGEFDMAMTLPGEPQHVDEGIIKIEPGTVAFYDIDDPADPEEFDFALETSSMTLEGYVGFDFDGDEIEEDAIVEVTLVR
jgi:hypothetical protein